MEESILQIGIQTLPFGPQVHDLGGVLRELGTIGFSGVELAQKVEFLPPLSDLRKELDAAKLELLSLTGGPLEQRLRYAELGCLEYFYADEWGVAEFEDCFARGFPLAFHPHVFKDFGSMSGFEEILRENQDLSLIIDTAHFHLVGDNPTEALMRHSERVKAIHVKDWAARHGRSPMRIARGFCRLGDGDLGGLISDVLRCAKSLDAFEGWIVVEQDYSKGNPLEDARHAFDWVKAHLTTESQT